MDNLLIIVVLAFAMVANFIIVKIKLEKKRYLDAIFDIGVFAVLAFIFFGTMGGMVLSGVASFIYSIYSWFSPPKMNLDLDLDAIMGEEPKGAKKANS